VKGENPIYWSQVDTRDWKGTGANCLCHIIEFPIELMLHINRKISEAARYLVEPHSQSRMTAAMSDVRLG
jgi:hypothetical protein